MTTKRAAIDSLFVNAQHSPKKDDEENTPQYVVVCKDFFSGCIDGLDGDAAPCLTVESGGVRHASFDSSGETSTDGRIKMLDPIITMKYGSWGPLIQESMFQGKHVGMMSVKRYISVQGEKVMIQELNYENCLIKAYQQDAEIITFSFCFVIITDINIKFDCSGQKIGNVAVCFDSSTMKVKT